MVIKLHIKYKTRYGQTFYILIKNSSKDNTDAGVEVKMEYLNEEFWHTSIDTADLDLKDTLEYSYILKEDWKADETDLCIHRAVNFGKQKSGTIDVFDEWQVVPHYDNVFLSKPFELVLNKEQGKPGKKDKPKKATHLFKAFVPFLQDDKVVCITGSAKEMSNWAEEEPVLFHKTGKCWSVALNLQKEQYPVAYKFGIYDLTEKKIVFYEDGSNRYLEYNPGKDKLVTYHTFPRFDQFKWQGAGVNFPVSSLKSEKSWGVGDFTDLHLLINWAKESGIKLIQLLPINDTTATHTFKDSYPYASISAFALHPLYLNVHKLAVAAGIDFSEDFQNRITALNDKPQLDYDNVVKMKSEAIRQLYYKERHSFKDDFAFFEFFDMNRYWLVPYAAFCYLRDLNNTPDPVKWEDYNVYDEHVIQELVSPDNAHYDEIAIHYYTQYHLHLQLLDAVEHAHKNGIILKGDLPIGVGRHSMETWMHPTLFHMDKQAGAPPDAFAVKGQNWEFPTYNWEEMGKNNYAWWRQRMEHMSNYFDAIRIDHILGFFRIWSIPHKDIEGILGTFVPSLPLGIHDFEAMGIYFEKDRFCNPFISEDTLRKFFPGNEAWVKENILSNYQFKSSFNSQQKIAAYFKKNPEKAFLQQSLFDLITDVILLEDEDRPGYFHFRISMQLTESYKNLDHERQQKLSSLYNRYFFEMQDELWNDVGQKKLNALQLNTNMLLCAEDLGMVPGFVESVLVNREILSLQVQRMPKKSGDQFANPQNAFYLSVVTPSTHDMSTLRQWWEEERDNIPHFYNSLLGHNGEAPFYCEPWICRDIIRQHIQSPAMWAVFLIQDIMAMDAGIRRENPADERINVPANPDHHWDYRMHVTLESLLEYKPLIDELKTLIKQSGR